MAKKQKTLADINLSELVSEISFEKTNICMYAKKEFIERVLQDAAMSEKFFNAIDSLQKRVEELQKRFNAPVHYQD